MRRHIWYFSDKSKSVIPNGGVAPAGSTFPRAAPSGTRVTARWFRRALYAPDSLVLSGPVAFAQPELLDLAGGGLRQRPELDHVRALVVRQPLAAERDDVLGGRRGAGVERDVRLRPLSPVRVRHPDDGAFEHGGVRA